MARSRRSAPASKAPAAKAPAPAPKPAPAPVAAAPPTVPAVPTPPPAQSGGMMGGLLGTVVEGMAMGTGSAIARHAVNAAIDSFSSDDKEPQLKQQAQQAQQSIAAAVPLCANDQKAFMECLNTRVNDISACQFYLDALNTCKQQSAFQ